MGQPSMKRKNIVLLPLLTCGSECIIVKFLVANSFHMLCVFLDAIAVTPEWVSGWEGWVIFSSQTLSHLRGLQACFNLNLDLDGYFKRKTRERLSEFCCSDKLKILQTSHIVKLLPSFLSIIFIETAPPSPSLLLVRGGQLASFAGCFAFLRTSSKKLTYVAFQKYR